VLITNNDKVFIDENALVKVTKMNHLIEVQHMEKMNRKANIKKLDSDRYLDIATGEIKEFKHSENRQQNYNSLRQTFKKLRYLINNNFTGKANELFITLTYGKKKKAYDPKVLYGDFKNFILRLNYKFKGQTTIDYISVVEPHAKGDFHCHVLMRFNELDKVFIKNKDLSELWGLGYVRIKSLNEVDNIGAYLSAYLADVELTDDNALQTAIQGQEVTVKVVEGQEKKFIKGGRLHMYPPGMNIYRKSKGILEPERVEMSFKEIKKVVGAATPNYQKSITIQDGEFQNTINYIQYNIKRT
jgi:hypothetical protein